MIIAAVMFIVMHIASFPVHGLIVAHVTVGPEVCTVNHESFILVGLTLGESALKSVCWYKFLCIDKGWLE